MEIPDAERDAGKEILYQITQQAFNELLDELFKKKEDLAIRAAETKEDRAKYQHLLKQINLEDEDEESTGKSPDRSQSPPSQPQRTVPIGERNLGELLSSSGYTVQPREDEDKLVDEEQSDKAAATKVEEAAQEDASGSEATQYRDPTMPQFRPNTTNGDASKPRSQRQVREPKPGAAGAAADHVPHSTLVTWKRLDLAEQEARDRGGWGRLSYAEFEAIYRELEFQDSSRNRLDYLGSWIDFCIP